MKIVATRVFLIPIKNRVPLKFGPETVTEVTCAGERRRGESGGAAFHRMGRNAFECPVGLAE